MKITIDHPHLEKGVELAILSNLAVGKNGETVDVDDETVALYEEQTGKKAEAAIGGSGIMSTGNEKPSTKRDKAAKELEKAEESETTTTETKEGGE